MPYGDGGANRAQADRTMSRRRQMNTGGPGGPMPMNPIGGGGNTGVAPPRGGVPPLFSGMLNRGGMPPSPDVTGGLGRPMQPPAGFAQSARMPSMTMAPPTPGMEEMMQGAPPNDMLQKRGTVAPPVPFRRPTGLGGFGMF